MPVPLRMAANATQFRNIASTAGSYKAIEGVLQRSGKDGERLKERLEKNYRRAAMFGDACLA